MLVKFVVIFHHNSVVILTFWACFLQDRIKEWGKRYLIPAAEWCGISVPDRVVKV